MTGSLRTLLIPLFYCFCLLWSSSTTAQEKDAVVYDALERADEDNWVEVAIVVHGITPNREVPDLDPGYIRFEETLKRAFYRLHLHHQHDFPFGPHNMVYIYYGSEKAQKFSGENPSNHLEQLQQIIGEFDAQAWQNTEDPPDSLLRQTAFKSIREILLYGISDAFYYNSTEGGQAIRSVILKQISNGLRRCQVLDAEGMLPEPYKLSFTIFGHSLGSIVMYDLLQYISDEETGLEAAVDDPEAMAILEGFFRLKKAGRVRVRKFFSMGTQIPVMYFKYNNTIEKMMDGEFRDLHKIFPADDQVRDPRWINLWDKDDILGYPFEHLFNLRPGTKSKIVIDTAVDAGDYLPHIAYWWSADVAERILIEHFELNKELLEERRR